MVFFFTLLPVQSELQCAIKIESFDYKYLTIN